MSEFGQMFDEAEDSGRTFHGEVSARTIGEFGLINFWGSGHTLSRKINASRTNPGLLVSLQLSGEAQLSQDSHSISVGAGVGAIGIVDGSKPFRLSFPGEAERIFVFVPRSRLGINASIFQDFAPKSLSANSPVVDILHRHMCTLADPTLQVDDTSLKILLDAFVYTLLATTSINSSRSGAYTKNMKRRIKLEDAIDRHLSDPCLSAAMIADELGMSIRLVYKQFEGSGTSFGRWVRDKRLDHCANALGLPNSPLSISETAYAAGFNDLSHFNKAFKTRFGVTPKGWRRLQAAAM
jgi:AraC family transcriptional activator of tynA and feaB